MLTIVRFAAFWNWCVLFKYKFWVTHLVQNQILKTVVFEKQFKPFENDNARSNGCGGLAGYVYFYY